MIRNSRCSSMQWANMLLRENLVVLRECFVAKTGEDHVLNLRRGLQMLDRLCHRDTRRALQWKAIRAGADRRKGDRSDQVFIGKVQRVAIAACEKLVFVVLSAVPHRADRVDHEFGGQIIPARDACLAGWASAELAAFLKKLRPG